MPFMMMLSINFSFFESFLLKWKQSAKSFIHEIHKSVLMFASYRSLQLLQPVNLLQPLLNYWTFQALCINCDIHPSIFLHNSQCLRIAFYEVSVNEGPLNKITSFCVKGKKEIVKSFFFLLKLRHCWLLLNLLVNIFILQFSAASCFCSSLAYEEYKYIKCIIGLLPCYVTLVDQHHKTF